MKKTLLTAGAISAFTLLSASASLAASYKITITNHMDSELIAPIVIVATAHDKDIFRGNYVTREAEEQILTGDPAKLVARIGSDASVVHGEDGPPGVLLAPGKSVTFQLDTKVQMLRFLAMVAPTEVPDNYLTAVVDLSGMMMDSMGGDTMKDDSMGSDTMKDDNMGSDTMKDDSMGNDTMMGDHGIKAEFSRYDIGHDEGTKTITSVDGMGWGTIKIELMDNM